MTVEKKNRSISTNEKLGAIEEFYKLNSQGSVVFTGGETMRKTDEFFMLSQKCKDLGLSCAANTNGTLINSKDIVKQLINHGPRYLVISLDSRYEEIHDQMRGVKGTYNNVLNAIRMLVDEKKAHPDTHMKIVTNSIIMDSNYSDLINYIEFARNLGIDGVMFQMLSRTFWKQTQRDFAFENYFPKDKSEFKKVIDEVIHRYSNDQFVITNAMDFKYMKMYVDNPDFTTEPVCASHEKNIMVDSYGDVFLCFSMREFLEGQCLGNIRKDSLKEMWTSELANKARSLMSQCRRNCGMLNCYRRSCI
jgi:MoaA/NifB/PqqE/SkfB family radical SAM enzyme